MASPGAAAFLGAAAFFAETFFRTAVLRGAFLAATFFFAVFFALFLRAGAAAFCCGAVNWASE